MAARLRSRRMVGLWSLWLTARVGTTEVALIHHGGLENTSLIGLGLLIRWSRVRIPHRLRNYKGLASASSFVFCSLCRLCAAEKFRYNLRMLHKMRR